MELYYIIAVTDRDRGEARWAALYQAAGLHLTLTHARRGARPRASALADLRAGRDAEKCVIVSAVGRCAEEADSLIRSKTRSGRLLDRHSGQRRDAGGAAQERGRRRGRWPI